MGKKRKPRGPKGGSRGQGGGSGGRGRRRRRPSDQGGVRPAPAADMRRIAQDNGEADALQPGSGMLELHPNGYGFLRSPANNYDRVRSDPFVPGTMIDKYGLREGLMITGHGAARTQAAGPPTSRNHGCRRNATRRTTLRSKRSTS